MRERAANGVIPAEPSIVVARGVTAYGLARLCERYGKERVDALCARALAFDVLDVPRIERMLKQARRDEESAPSGKVVALPTSRFARDVSAFATMTRPTKGGE
jgi:hypothetical protein